jgi:hypothetical protein
MGMDFLAGIFFLCRYGFGQVIPSRFLPIAISKTNTITYGHFFISPKYHCIRHCVSVRTARPRTSRSSTCFNAGHLLPHYQSWQTVVALDLSTSQICYPNQPGTGPQKATPKNGSKWPRTASPFASPAVKLRTNSA